MKKIAFFFAAAALLASCTKWENKSTEFKVTGVWTGINQQVNIQVAPFIDSTILQTTTDMEANFMDNGGLTIDSAGTRIDSMSWSILNDTVLVLGGVDISAGGLGAIPAGKMHFNIKTLEQDAFTFRYDTTFSMVLDPALPAFNVDLTQIQRWGK